MSLKRVKTEGGSGGKRGHSNMDHRDHTEDIKVTARIQRRVQARRTVEEALVTLERERTGPWD